MDLQKQEGKLEHQEMMLKEIIVENKNLRETNAYLIQQNRLFAMELSKKRSKNVHMLERLLKENKQLKDELSIIYNSRGWKAVKCYWRLMDKTLPRLLFSPIKAIINCFWRKSY